MMSFGDAWLGELSPGFDYAICTLPNAVMSNGSLLNWPTYSL